MRILGIDPGSNITGYAIIEIQNKKATAINYGCITIKNKELPEKLATIHNSISELIKQYCPAVLAIEQVFVGKNIQSALKLGQARGAAIAAAGQFALELYEYSPRNIKQAIVGYGAAEKGQIQLMVRHLLGIKQAIPADAADALAVALCHAHQPTWLKTQSLDSACAGTEK